MVIKKMAKNKLVKKAKPKVKKKIIKKSVKAPLKKEKLIGKVIHYYNNIGVAVLKLKAPLKAGDEIHITGGKETDFKQKIVSMQANHKPLKKANKGAEIGLKVKEKVRDGYGVYL